MGKPCGQCFVYRMEILRLKLEIQRLHQIIHKLNKKLERIEDETKIVLSESQPVVTKPSGVKRAVFAWHKSRYEVAAKIWHLLR